MAVANSSTHSASCLCGAIKLEIVGNPLTFMVCHCGNCQKSSGSAFMSNTFFKAKDVRISQGKEKIKEYEDKVTKSGRTLLRSFCEQCASTILLRNPDSDILGVPAGILDDTLDWVPRKELFPHNKKPWVKDIQTKAKL